MFHAQRECILCHRVETITKIPSFTLGRAPSGPSESRVGKVVDEFIKDAKKELREQRKDLKTEYTPK